MTYEDAKKLKDNGYVSEVSEHDHDFCIQNGCWFNENYVENGVVIHKPLLDELIEEIGERFYVLVYDYDLKTWFAEAWDDITKRNPQIDIRVQAGGETRLKAVCELWLKLKSNELQEKA